VIGPYVVDNMRKKLGDLKTSAVPVIANQYRIERMLEAEEKKLVQLNDDARQAVLQHDDELAGNILLQKESCEARVNDLKAQLIAAQRHAEEAKEQIELFQEELKEAEDRARNMQMRYQLATMRQQVQKFAMKPSLDEDMKALERLEERADQAYAEAEAMSDITALNDDHKLRKVRQASRKARADQALADLKAEMGLSDTEKRFKKVSVEIGDGEQSVDGQAQDADQLSAEQQVQQRIVNPDTSGEKSE
jgi:phage shock protein A